MNERFPDQPEIPGHAGRGTGETHDHHLEANGRELDYLQSLPDDALFYAALEQLRKETDSDIRPIKVFQGRFGPMGLGWVRRKFGIPFGSGMEIVTTADTDAWNYVLYSAPQPSLTAWRVRYFSVLQRQSLYELTRLNRSRRIPDEAEEECDETFAVDALSREDLVTLIQTVQERDGRPNPILTDYVTLENQALEKCRYCPTKPFSRENPEGCRCLIFWKTNEEELTLKEIEAKTGLTVHDVRTAYAKCQSRLRDMISK